MTIVKNLSGRTPIERLIWPITAAMLVVSALLIGVTFYSGKQMDVDASNSQSAMIDNALTSRIRSSLGELQSVAWWDDTVVRSAPNSFDQTWLDKNIGSYMAETYRHDAIFILSESNAPVYSYFSENSKLTSKLPPLLTAAKPIILQARGGSDVSPRVLSSAKPGELYERGGFGNRKYSRGFGMVAQVEGQPVLIIALLITPSFDTSINSPQRRIALTITKIDDETLTAFGQDLLMHDLSFLHKRDVRKGQYALKTDTGQLLRWIKWTPKQPGSEMVRRVLPLIIMALIIALSFMGVLIRRLFLSTRALAEREEEARFLADHDALTRLPNRRMFQRLYKEHFADPNRSGAQLLMAVIDLDRFKDINDTLGHPAGDALIKAVAARMRSRLDQGDILARLGGDELAILRAVPWAVTTDSLSPLIKNCFAKPFEVVGHQIETNASVGLAFATPEDGFDDVIKWADIALYDAKSKGRGRSARFNDKMAKAIEERHAIEIDLKRAIAAKELTMNYQPIVEAATGAISSVEALVRWTSPTHGNITPDVFVSIAEECGMMADLGRFVINQSIEDARRWPEISTAINISPAQLRSATIVNDLLGPCRLFGVAPSKITIEITESVLMSNDDRTLRILNEIKSHGFMLALDDFGTGYSSLSYIRDFPFDRLKIDRSFVQGLSVNDRALAIVEGVVNFGKILGREIVAEGIETEQEMQAMQSAGCTHLQGFLFSRALPADHIEAIAATFGRLSATRPPRANVGQAKAELIMMPKRKTA